MPIYEYECTKCGEIKEVMQKFSDRPLAKCGKCSGKLQKLISHSSFHLKGTGWYVTDYANKSKNSSTSPKSENKGKSSSSKKNGDTSTPNPGKSAKSAN
jgi:putative FmdB family regulatory protein